MFSKACGRYTEHRVTYIQIPEDLVIIVICSEFRQSIIFKVIEEKSVHLVSI